MKTMTKTIATIALTISIFAFPVFADCGEMGNGNRCLVQQPDTIPTSTKIEKKIPADQSFADFFRDFLGKIFG